MQSDFSAMNLQDECKHALSEVKMMWTFRFVELTEWQLSIV